MDAWTRACTVRGPSRSARCAPVLGRRHAAGNHHDDRSARSGRIQGPRRCFARAAQLESGRLAAAAEGNPLFLEQLAAELERVGDSWDPSTVPTTIRAFLEARLDRCSPEVSRILSVASVEGSRFHLDVVGALGQESVDVRGVLQEADRAHLAQEIEPNIGVFAHSLIRETAYRRLPKATRADLHAGLAELLSDDDELAGTHLEQAAALRAELGHRDPDVERRAGERLARTGIAAFARINLETSADLLERAARLLPADSAARLELLPDLAVALMENGRTGDARALLAGAVEEAERLGSRRNAIRIRLQQLALFVYVDVSEAEIRAGIAEGRSLLDELLGFGDDAGLAQGWVAMEYLHWLVGELANIEDAAGLAVAHAERAGRLREQIVAGADQAVSLILGPLPVSKIRERALRSRESTNPIVAAGGEAGVAAAAALADSDGYRAAEARWRYAVESGGLEWPGANHATLGWPPCSLKSGIPCGRKRSRATVTRPWSGWATCGHSTARRSSWRSRWRARAGRMKPPCWPRGARSVTRGWARRTLSAGAWPCRQRAQHVDGGTRRSHTPTRPQRLCAPPTPISTSRSHWSTSHTLCVRRIQRRQWRRSRRLPRSIAHPEMSWVPNVSPRPWRHGAQARAD